MQDVDAPKPFAFPIFDVRCKQCGCSIAELRPTADGKGELLKLTRIYVGEAEPLPDGRTFFPHSEKREGERVTQRIPVSSPARLPCRNCHRLTQPTSPKSLLRRLRQVGLKEGRHPVLGVDI